MQIEELATKLEQLGLSDKEARVYVANLFLGPAPVQRIAEQAGINRATCYVILDQLCQLGLVSESPEGKKTAYIAEGPEALERLFGRQQELIEERRRELQALLPELSSVERTHEGEAPVVRFYRGPEGIKAISDYLKRKSDPHTEILGVTNYDEVLKVFPHIFAESPKQRLKKRMPSRVIYSFQGGEVASDPKLLRQTKRLAEPVKADINLYEASATFLTYGGKESVGVIIESKEIVSALRQLFDLAWSAKPK